MRAKLTHSDVLAEPPSTSSSLHLLSDAQKEKREKPKGRDQTSKAGEVGRRRAHTCCHLPPIAP